MELQAKTCPTFLSEMVVLIEVGGVERCEKGETLVRVGRFRRGGASFWTILLLVLFVRRCDEDHLLILGLGWLGSVGPQMTDQANLRLKQSRAVGTGNGGSCCSVSSSVLLSSPAFFSHSGPVRLARFGTFVDS